LEALMAPQSLKTLVAGIDISLKVPNLISSNAHNFAFPEFGAAAPTVDVGLDACPPGCVTGLGVPGSLGSALWLWVINAVRINALKAVAENIRKGFPKLPDVALYATKGPKTVAQN
jgi:hypothetical protein